MRPTYILFDADGVLVDSQHAMIDAALAIYGVVFYYEDWHGFGTLYNAVLAATNAAPKEIEEQLFGIDVLNRGKPTPGSREVLERLHQLNFVPIVATGRPDDQTEGTLEWFLHYFGDLIDGENIFLRPPGEPAFAFKRRVLLNYRAIALVEDSLELMTLAAADPELAKVLLGLVDRPWNQSEDFPESEYRMRMGNFAVEDFGWKAFVNRVKSIS